MSSHDEMPKGLATFLAWVILIAMAFSVALGLAILGLIGTGIWLLLKIGGCAVKWRFTISSKADPNHWCPEVDRDTIEQAIAHLRNVVNGGNFIIHSVHGISDEKPFGIDMNWKLIIASKEEAGVFHTVVTVAAPSMRNAIADFEAAWKPGSTIISASLEGGDLVKEGPRQAGWLNLSTRPQRVDLKVDHIYDVEITGESLKSIPMLDEHGATGKAKFKSFPTLKIGMDDGKKYSVTKNARAVYDALMAAINRKAGVFQIDIDEEEEVIR